LAARERPSRTEVSDIVALWEAVEPKAGKSGAAIRRLKGDLLMETSKKASALRQTEVAITLFQSGHLDCAITLSAAAEGMLPNTDAPFVFAQLRQEPSASDIDFNLIINWLKHSGSPETAVITEFEATWIIARAITKYIAVYRQSCKTFEEFLRWGQEAGHLPRLSANISN
jgi:hypothetical protein